MLQCNKKKQKKKTELCEWTENCTKNKSIVPLPMAQLSTNFPEKFVVEFLKFLNFCNQLLTI